MDALRDLSFKIYQSGRYSLKSELDPFKYIIDLLSLLLGAKLDNGDRVTALPLPVFPNIMSLNVTFILRCNFKSFETLDSEYMRMQKFIDYLLAERANANAKALTLRRLKYNYHNYLESKPWGDIIDSLLFIFDANQDGELRVGFLSP